jgi:cardiolipin synthase
MQFNLPNNLTIFRIIIIPILIASFYIDGFIANVVAALLFAIACITDYFDGYFARSMKLQSNFGKCLDPIADKLIVVVAIVMLVNFNPHNPWILFPGLIIICREVLVSGLREFLAELNVNVAVSKLSKYKTAVQMVAITGLLLGEQGSQYTIESLFGNELDLDNKEFLKILWVELSRLLFVLAAALTVLTGYRYLQTGFSRM